ncbi:MAG TPA: hypothetical protein VEI96_01935 [Thermodesulfovibrionales bacterium]|nr:hypothetical protein [Thermodesulfovibrionales bacterium]
MGRVIILRTFSDILSHLRSGEWPLAMSLVVVSLLLAIASSCQPVFAFSEDEVRSFQKEIAERPLHERIALWAERFVGTPYDPDPLGEYVTRQVIVADERVDCMYLSFRTVELAIGRTPEEAVMIALDKRFIVRGISEGGRVVNYDERFQYGEDMIESGKWGREITADIAPPTFIEGARGRERVGMISKESLRGILQNPERAAGRFESGDFVFFIKSPEKRHAGEIVGHIGVIKREEAAIYLIHAGGKKKGGGSVKKVLFSEYVESMPFAGVRVSRFD